MSAVVTSQWAHCYDDAWQGLLTPESFCHPAKMAPGLLRAIFAHARAEGWLVPGGVCLDPFAGVGTTALEALRHGCAYIGVELESRFFALAQANIAQWMYEYRHLPGWGPWAMVVNGDSRELLTHVPAQHTLAVSSPPYAHSVHDGNGIDASKLTGNTPGRHSQAKAEGYGHTPGNLADMAVASPPYAGAGEVLGAHNGIDWTKTTGTGQRLTPGRAMQPYGSEPGQMGAMPAGDLVVSSPPYSSSTQVNNTPGDMTAGKARWADGTESAARVKQDYADYTTPGNLATLTVASPPYANGCAHTGGSDPHPEHVQGGAVHHVAYGMSDGQLGAMPAVAVSSPPYEGGGHHKGVFDTWGGALSGEKGCAGWATKEGGYGGNADNIGNVNGDTFWTAAHTVVAQTYTLLKPGGVAIWVLKAYVRDKKLVDFPGQWQAMCESVGFVTLHEHHAMLVEDHGTQEGLFGEETTTVYQTHRKSFFRRLAEKKGSPRIDYEVVLCMEKGT